jgi:sialic acid synthase SpsE
MACAAAAMGANLFEKHSRRRAACRDRISRFDGATGAERPGEGIRAVELASGATKQIQPGEQDVRHMANHSVVSLGAIPAGRVIAAEDVWVKRPGTGIPASELPRVVGRRARRAIAGDALVSWDDLES